ncbi:hypothetical protein SLEP1_g38613 [Rubroshorea leprosula]|uniref:Ribosomal protein L32 n=1 Tax=Rubroshorea leprosula TaxID=152421 RepID=A0AAV5KY92_9ROSI|nr:hypothetical protein SLEP1_g38613 [Rubroshorea leprosula]
MKKLADKAVTSLNIISSNNNNQHAATYSSSKANEIFLIQNFMKKRDGYVFFS